MRADVSRILRVVGWPVRTLLIAAVLAYRRTVGQVVAGRCRFQPTCSAYGLEAIRVHGAAKGMVLAVWRVLRCSPLTPGGRDPVPPPGQWGREGVVR